MAYFRATSQKTHIYFCPHLQIFLAVPKVSIEGVGDAGGDIHAQAGSQVVLRCLVQNTLVKPRFVHW